MSDVSINYHFLILDLPFLLSEFFEDGDKNPRRKVLLGRSDIEQDFERLAGRNWFSFLERDLSGNLHCLKKLPVHIPEPLQQPE